MHSASIAFLFINKLIVGRDQKTLFINHGVVSKVKTTATGDGLNIMLCSFLSTKLIPPQVSFLRHVLLHLQGLSLCLLRNDGGHIYCEGFYKNFHQKETL